MNGLFRKVPLRDNYKDVPDDIVRLKAPPNISRGCFIFEITVASIAFALSFYISFTSTVSVTSITYEPLDAPYVCKVLSPRSDSQAFSTVTNEMVAFSSARFLLDECTTTLDSSGLDVCADGQRQDHLLGFSGVSAQDSNCFDILLQDNLRFCRGSETETRLSSESFPIGASKPTTIYTSSFLYFMNDSSTVRGFSAPFSSQLSDWVVSDNKIYTLAPRNTDNRNYLFEFDPLLGSTSWTSLAAPKELVFVDVAGNTVIGLAVTDNVVHVWTINAQNALATLFSYSIASNVLVSHTYDCASLTDTAYSTQNNVYRYLASSEEGTLYAMCGKDVYNGAYTFYSIDTTTYTATKLHADLLSLTIDKNGVASNDSVNAVSTLTVLNNNAYFTTGGPIYNIIQVDLTPQPTPAPTIVPSVFPSRVPTSRPTPGQTTQQPVPGSPPPLNTDAPTMGATVPPTILPTILTTILPTTSTVAPTVVPTTTPTAVPTVVVSVAPTVTITAPPSEQPSVGATTAPTITDTTQPTSNGSPAPSITMTTAPTAQPSIADTVPPTITDTAEPTSAPTEPPTLPPTLTPTLAPTPTPIPTLTPTTTPTSALTPGSSPAGSPAPPGPPGPPGMPSVRRLMESPVGGVSGGNGGDVGGSSSSGNRVRGGSEVSGDSGGDGGDLYNDVGTQDVDSTGNEIYNTYTESHPSQHIHRAGHQQLTAGPYNYIYQPSVNLGFQSGVSLQRGYGNTVYVTSDSAPFVSSYYNITSGVFEQYDSLRSDYFMTTAVELGYSFAVCNGAVLNDTTVDPTVSTSYKDICDDINGIYYQNNHYYTMPASCTSVFSTAEDPSTTTVAALSQCAAVSALVANYTAINCAASFEKICDASYTDNPPFSCTSHERPDFLTTLGSALSNASALWSLIAILISLTLRRAYPGGVLASLYDPHDGELKSEKVKYKYAHGAAVYPVCEDVEDGGGGEGGKGGGGGGGDVRYEKMDRQGSFGDSGERDGGEGEGGIGADDGVVAEAGVAPVVARSKSSKSSLSAKSSNNINTLSHKPAKKEEEADGCCVSFMDECQC